jgi:hypothetical protein
MHECGFCMPWLVLWLVRALAVHVWNQNQAPLPRPSSAAAMFIFQFYLGAEGSQVTSGNLKTILHGRVYPPVTSEDLAAAARKDFGLYGGTCAFIDTKEMGPLAGRRESGGAGVARRRQDFGLYWVLLPPSQTELDEATVARMYEAAKRSITALGRPLIVQTESGGAAEELIRLFTGAGFKSEMLAIPGIKELPDGKYVVNEDLVSSPW